MKKCINLANSTFNLYVLYIKLAQNTKQFRRLVLENFVTVINFLFGRKSFYGFRPWVFELLNISPPPHCASKPLPYNPRGGGGGGTLNFSAYEGSGPASTLHPKKYQEFQAPKKKYVKF